ncbi:hypothetical protein Lal_00026110 [Lupinus albus]|nr:hypothetical protein Lal_00026110 [Lupinus albus]
MKKMKGVVSNPYPLYEDQRTRLRHKSLLQDYEDLQKETNGMRIKLQVAKQKKSMLAAEVRFLRQRYTYLMKNPSSKPQPTQDVSQLRNLKTEASIPSKSWSYRRKESTLRPPIASHLRTKQKNSNGVDFVLQKPARMFDLNQSARSLCKQDASFLSSAPSLELNHKNRIYAGKEATKNSVAPFFDLNQISTEEEELLGNVEPLRIDKSKRLTQIDEDEEQRNDIKLSVCRNIGSGSNRTGKRKISWQDQMALRNVNQTTILTLNMCSWNVVVLICDVPLKQLLRNHNNFTTMADLGPGMGQVELSDPNE